MTQPYDPTSLAAWEEHATQVIQLSDKLAVKVKTLDVLDYLTGEEGRPNPLMAALQKEMGTGSASGQGVMRDPEALPALQEMLTKLMLDVVVSPPLIEQGHEHGISVKQIKLEYKFQIFTELMGGQDGITRLSTFREEPGTSMVVGPAVQAVSDNA